MSESRSHPRRRTLVFRLSSLGDVILSTAALEALRSAGGTVDWVVAKEFAPVLRGHPAIGRLWEFDRRSGLGGWLRLCDELAAQHYDQVLDLHGSLRTRVARAYLALKPGSGDRPWHRFSKARWRLYGLYLLKRRWPERWRPRPFVERFARFAGGTGGERPNLRYLLARQEAAGALQALRQELGRGAESPRAYFCVMPSSRWQGKCWPTERYLDVIRSLSARATAVVLGASGDLKSRELIEKLKKSGVPHFSGVGRGPLEQVAGVLGGAIAYLGNDTGLAHLAEAVGVPAVVIYGPTSPKMGFGPWRPASVAVELETLGCRPCGKDGRRCYRLGEPYVCLKGLGAEQVTARLRELTGEGRS